MYSVAREAEPSRPAGTAASKTVIVLGMHRSGTSAVAGILYALGINMGTTTEGERWVGRHWSNPTGHFENPAFLALNQRILGGDATGLRGVPKWQDLSTRGAQFLPDIARLLSASESELWGWKDPWSVLTIDLYLPLLKNPYFIIVHRDPAEIRASLRKRAAQSDEEIEQLIGIYDRKLAELAKTLPPLPVLHIHYRELTDRPGPELQRLVDFIGLRPTGEQLERALGMVLKGPELRRQSRRMAVTGLLEFPRWVGWVLKRDLGTNPAVVPSDMVSAIPKELFQSLRALL
jgi:hypothetical protein